MLSLRFLLGGSFLDEGKWRERGDGVLECVNERGEIIAVQKRKDSDDPAAVKRRQAALVRNKETHHYVMDSYGRALWVPKGTNPDDLPRLIYPFSQITCDHICRFVSEGKTLTDIGKMLGLPPTHVIAKWAREVPEFKAQLVEAKKLRAEFRADQVVAIANQKISEKRAPGERLRADVLKWAAEMDDRATFGKQTKVVGDASQPIAFTVVTGVPEPTIPQKTVEYGPDGRVLAAPSAPLPTLEDKT